MRNRLAIATLVGLALVFGSAHAFTLTVAQGSDIVTLDPQGQNDQPSARVRAQIFDTLVIQTEDLELEPGLASSWEQIDDVTWRFHVREDVTFHNGDPLTASDVVFTLNRMRDPDTASPAAFLVGFIENVEAVDDMTVEITTDAPFAPILAHLAHSATSIINERSVTEAGDDFGTEVAVGTGPFKFVSWETASRVELERNEDYWGGEVLAERVVFRPIVEGTVRAIELEAGSVDIAYALEPRDALRLEDHPSVVMAPIETLSTQYVGFNAEKAPFDDVRVRQAINHAIDSETIVDVIYEGFGSPATSPISSQVFGANLDLEGYDYDPERARELLAEAGHEDGFSTTVWTNDNPLRIQIAEIMQAQLAEVGIDVDVEVLEWSTYLSDTAAGAHEMFILGWVTVTADADYGLYALFHSDNYGSAGNRTFWSDPRVDELLDLGRQEADQDLRADYYYEAQEIIAEEAPWIFLNTSIENNAVRDNIVGFVPHPAGHHKLWQVDKQ